MTVTYRVPARRSRGFTLVELLVVLVIIGMLLALLLPAVQKAREAARVKTCANNLRQIALAVANFESKNGHYPASFNFTPPDADGEINGWSCQAVLLPYLEQSNLFAKVDFTQSYEAAGNVTTADGRVTKLSGIRVPTYLCPSEERDEPKLSAGAPADYPLTYGMNLGVWLVYDPQSGAGGDGVFYPGSRVRAADIRDGTSQTLCAAEVKAWTPYYRNAAKPGPLALPATPDVSALGGDFRTNSGHTEWVDGRAHQTGFTTTFRPNEKTTVTVNGETFQADWTNQQEGKSATAPTYAAVTARSYHVGGVNAAMMDGSVRWFEDSIDLGVWRAYSTRRGGEIIPSDGQAR